MNWSQFQGWIAQEKFVVQLLRKMQRLRRKEMAYPDWEVLQISHRTTKGFGQPFISSLSISHDFFYMVHGDRLVLKSKRFYFVSHFHSTSTPWWPFHGPKAHNTVNMFSVKHVQYLGLHSAWIYHFNLQVMHCSNSSFCCLSVVIHDGLLLVSKILYSIIGLVVYFCESLKFL